MIAAEALDTQENGPSPTPARKLGWRTLLAVALGYAVVAAGGAHWGTRWDPTREFPSLYADALQHLWVMKWYKTCLLEGRSPLICPDVEYPVGSPIGNFSPLHLQSALYLPLSFATNNDILTYNILWLIGFVFTGFGTFVLAWTVTRSRLAAGFAGLAAMLSGPMTARACGHLELMYLGCFPLFLAAWIRFVDRPDRRRMLLAAGGLLLTAFSAAYYLVYAIVPAGLYLGWAAWKAREGESWSWVRARIRPLVGFTFVVLPILALAFAGHVWAAAQGYSPGRSAAEFEKAATPPWGYLFPLPGKRFESAFPYNPYREPGVIGAPWASNAYLGLVPLALIAVAALGRARFPRRSYWWAALATLMVLSFGARWQVGGWDVPLPATWLRAVFLPFRMIREVDRLNLFAAILAAILAAVGLRHLIARRRRRVRVALALAASVMTVVELSSQFLGHAPPPMPACYEAILASDPDATFLEVNGADLNAATGYWQSVHRGRTSAWFSGLANVHSLNLLTLNSPFAVNWVESPDYLKDSARHSFNHISTAQFQDYAWLYLHAHGLRYVVVHKGGAEGAWNPPSLPRLDALLSGAKVFEDDLTAVYDRDRLPPPTRPVLLCHRGWKSAWNGALLRVAGRSARVLAYNPDPGTALEFELAATASGRPREVRLLTSRGDPLASWNVEADAPGRYRSGPFKLPAGLVRLILKSDGEAPLPTEIDGLDPGPFSLQVERLALEPAPTAEIATGAAGVVR